MTLNTTSTTGLLGGHTWRYGSTDDDGKAETAINVADGDAGNAWANPNTGDYFNLVSSSGVSQNYVFSRNDTSGGGTAVGTGVVVAAGDNIGGTRKSNVAGITVGLTNALLEGDTITQIRLAVENASSTQNTLFTLVQEGDNTTNGKVSLSFTQNDPGTSGNTTINFYTWSAGTAGDGTNTDGSANPGTVITGTWTDLEQTFPLSFTGGLSKRVPFEDELVIEGKFVNSVAGSDEKAGLTRVNNSTELTSPTTTADATQLGRARRVARAFLAYKKKKK
tara:strand:- start:15195 stop:16028 length:834 start_codon:yes stop_codon:yes gene_type:complete